MRNQSNEKVTFRSQLIFIYTHSNCDWLLQKILESLTKLQVKSAGIFSDAKIDTQVRGIIRVQVEAQPGACTSLVNC